jgi:hypothetical protein
MITMPSVMSLVPIQTKVSARGEVEAGSMMPSVRFPRNLDSNRSALTPILRASAQLWHLLLGASVHLHLNSIELQCTLAALSIARMSRAMHVSQ